MVTAVKQERKKEALKKVTKVYWTPFSHILHMRCRRFLFYMGQLSPWIIFLCFLNLISAFIYYCSFPNCGKSALPNFESNADTHSRRGLPFNHKVFIFLYTVGFETTKYRFKVIISTIPKIKWMKASIWAIFSISK